MKKINFVVLILAFAEINFSNAQLYTSAYNNSMLTNLLGPEYTIDQSSIVVGGYVNDKCGYSLTNDWNSSQGLLLTSGDIYAAGNGPHGPNNKTNAGVDNGAPGLGILSSLYVDTTYNASWIEFEFVSSVDHIDLQFFYCSEEYVEFCASQYIDIAAIYIKGPGIVPSNSTGYRLISLTPGSSILSYSTIINSRNISPFVPDSLSGTGFNWQGYNSSYYLNNAGGLNFQYDGCTALLNAHADLIPGQTYTILFAVADTEDAIYDSGLFIKNYDPYVILGNEENIESSKIAIFPNPAEDLLNVKLTSEIQSAIVNIYSLNGDLVLSKEVNHFDSTVSIVELSGGSYIVKVISSDQELTIHKLIKR